MVPLAELKTYLGLTGSADDAYLASLEQRCVATVESLSGWYLGTAVEFSDILDVEPQVESLTGPTAGYRPQHVHLPRPVESLVGMELYERPGPGSAWPATPTATTEGGVDVFRLDGLRIYREIGAWTAGPATVKAVYTVGWAEGSAPAKFEDVVLALCGERYEDPTLRRMSSRVTGASIRGASVQFESGARGATPSDAVGISPGLLTSIYALRVGGWY